MFLELPKFSNCGGKENQALWKWNIDAYFVESIN